MTIEKFAEIKERMMIAKQRGDIEQFKKYYELVVKGYEELTGKKFEQKMEEMIKNNKGMELGD